MILAVLATQFPPDFPFDPAYRLIAATVRAEDLTLITRDERIRKRPLVKTLWSRPLFGHCVHCFR